MMEREKVFSADHPGECLCHRCGDFTMNGAGFDNTDRSDDTVDRFMTAEGADAFLAADANIGTGSDHP